MMYGWNGGWGWGWGIGMFLAMIIPVVILGLVIYFAVFLGSKNAARKTEMPPMEILKARYARGEIDSEEFNRLKGEIRQE